MNLTKPIGSVTLTPALAVALGAVLLLWRCDAGRDAVERDRLVQRGVTLAATVDSLTRSEDERRQEREAAERVIAQQGARIVTLERRDAEQKRALDTMTARLAGEVPDSVRPLLAAVIAGYEARLAGKDSVIAALAADTVILRAQLVVADSAVAGFHRAMHEAIEQTEQWRRIASRNVFKRVKDALPWMAGAYLLAQVMR